MNIEKSIAYFKQTFYSDAKPDIELDKEDAPFCLNYSDDFSVFFLCDCGDHYAVMQEKHFKESSFSADELLAIGIGNLRAVADEIKINQNEGLLYFSGSGDFEASLLLVPEIWSDWLAEYCPNGYVAAIPARDILVVSDKHNESGIEKLISIIERIWPDGDHLLSNSLYHQSGQKWVPYKNA
ncbi:DUF1444 family protein [Microbulbifer harenosus]|uniref:DUF1444 family protein n=1 Tax=Microbulbifer harenosus TaxID=2576840 RepID=A0ABY2UCJ7_9GAMM|nr:DUF1444 family protein [Microbulbifer harenosus]TLM73372.1 DUF1444 family protein [Microbulbifer harenosus]